MSTTWDRSQKFTFIWNNLYQVYQRSKKNADPKKVLLDLPSQNERKNLPRRETSPKSK